MKGTPEEQYDRGISYALHLLSARQRSRQDVEGRLLKKGYDPDVVIQILERLVELELLDDGKFAEQWAATRHKGKGLSRSAIKRELNTHGISQELIETSLESISDEAELKAAYEIAQARVSRLRGLSQDVQIRRLVSLLARRGYSGGVAFKVAKDVTNSDIQEPDLY